jgi:hypothetical protein
MTKGWTTKLIHSDAKVPQGFKALTVPVEHDLTN